MRVKDFAGGTNLPGVPASAFAMPPGMRMRYDVPAPALANCVTGYAIYAADSRAPMFNWYLPAPPKIIVLLDAGPLSVRLRNRDVHVEDHACVWGPTAHAYRTTTHGGISVGIGLSAEGWSRLAARSARPFANQVVPLTQFTSANMRARLVDALEAVEDDADLAGVLDRMLPEILGPERPGADKLRALDRLVLSDGVIGVEDMAERMGLDPQALRRLAADHCGVPVKALLTRARFVRSFVRWLMAGEPASYQGIDSSYHDVSHFLRDAGKYLGTTPRRFARLEIPYLRASLRARAAVIGPPAHALHKPG